MPQLLLEILSEEIPARMQAKAEADLVKALMDGLTAAGIIPGAIKGFSGPRRLVAVVEDLPAKSADVTEDIQGPKEGAPQPAIDGFLRKAGLKSISEAHLHDVPKKGKIYVAHVRKPGRETAALVAELVPQIIRGFHWPKSMRWGSGDLRWVRPISRILCTFDGEVVPFEIEGIKSDCYTEGHRVMGRGPYRVRRFEDYEDVLKNKGRVILDREERKETILTEAKQLCAAQNLELVDDIGLLEEVAGLAEYPVVIIGDMDKSFLDLPPEVIKLSMRTHQKYFAVRYPQEKGGADAKLAPKFIVVANLDAADGGQKIAEGNSRVLSARLNDARFFWDNDRKIKLEDRFEKLGQIVFHEKLGTVKDKVDRMSALAVEIAPLCRADANASYEAARLAKCDLVSDMVGEFPELEGTMGRYYAGLESKPAAIADAIRDHYRPRGPSDEIPSNGVSVTVSVADKLDTLVGFWTIGEKPTGGGDKFGLRRAALGIIRTALATKSRIKLTALILLSFGHYVRLLPEEGAHEFFAVDESGNVPTPGDEIVEKLRASKNLRFANDKLAVWIPDLAGKEAFELSENDDVIVSIREHFSEFEAIKFGLESAIEFFGYSKRDKVLLPAKYNSREEAWEHYRSIVTTAAVLFAPKLVDDLLSFFADRLKVHLRDQGARHDLVDAVFALKQDDLVLIVKRVEALGEFLGTDDGKNLLAGYKRAANILAIEEKKDGKSYSGEGRAMPGDPPEVDALLSALKQAAPSASAALEKEDFAGAMKALSKLRGPVDAFFDEVTVNADKPDVRENRLKLLSQIRDALNRVADFSRIEG